MAVPVHLLRDAVTLGPGGQAWLRSVDILVPGQPWSSGSVETTPNARMRYILAASATRLGCRRPARRTGDLVLDSESTPNRACSCSRHAAGDTNAAAVLLREDEATMPRCEAAEAAEVAVRGPRHQPVGVLSSRATPLTFPARACLCSHKVASGVTWSRQVAARRPARRREPTGISRGRGSRASTSGISGAASRAP